MSDWRFANSHITQTALLGGSYLVYDWPADVRLPWSVASGNVVTPYAIRIQGLGGHTRYQGETRVAPWIFDVLTGEMFDYLASTLFGGSPSIDATIYTFNQRAQAWQTYQCIATLSEITTESLQPWGNTGFKGAQIDFSKCELNTS
jgi:hypothetical protein